MGELLPFRRPETTATEHVRGPVPRVVPPPREGSCPTGPEPLWREAAGAVLRERRHGLEQTLAEVADRAGISVQYLSEVERGRKEPSSEVLAAVAGALGLRLVDLTVRVSRRLVAASRPSGPVCLAA